MNPPTPDPDESIPSTGADEQALFREVVRISRNVLGLTLGMLFACGLFLATNILVIKGGRDVGEHLQLLNHFFPGYKVTFAGSLVGAVYGLVVGYVSGWVIATVYNGVVFLRHR